MSIQSQTAAGSDRSTILHSHAAHAVRLDLLVTDPEVCAELATRPEGSDQSEFALTALRIGVMAIRQAQGRIDADVVRNEGDRLVKELAHRLEAHHAMVNDNVTNSLKSYFDPEGGRFTERVERLIKNDGEIEQILKRQIGPSDSQLAKTLTEHVGANSDLMKILHPRAADGLLSSISETTETTLRQQREHILQEFSLDNKEGALARLIAELHQKQGEAGEELEKRIDAMVAEFSLDKKDSALSRLVGRVESAQRLISSEFSLDKDDSALARLRKELVSIADKEQKSRDEFYRNVTSALADMTARKEESKRGTQHGLEFEDALYTCLTQLSSNTDDVVEATGSTTGQIRNCKVGDIVIELGPEHIASGTRIVVEAKQKQGYNVKAALEEVGIARKNREAEVGLFVFSSASVSADRDVLTRYGNDIVLVWDAEDPSSDVVLRAALSLARALCTKSAGAHDHIEVDFDLLDKTMLDIEKQLQGFDEVSKSANTVVSAGGKILNRARIMQESISKHVEVLNDVIADARTLVEAGMVKH